MLPGSGGDLASVTAPCVFFFLLIIGVVREGGCSDGCGVVDVRCIIRRNDMQSFRSIYGEKMVFLGRSKYVYRFGRFVN